MQTQIKKFVSRLVLAALATVDSFFISKIKNAVVQEGLRRLVAPLRAVTVALADDNPRNEEQVLEIFKKFANQDVPEYAQGQIEAALNKVDDANVRQVLATLSTPVIQMLRVTTDGDPNNKAQLKALFDEFVKSPATQDVAVQHIVLPLVAAKIKDPALREWLLSILVDLLDEDGNGGTLAGK